MYIIVIVFFSILKISYQFINLSYLLIFPKISTVFAGIIRVYLHVPFFLKCIIFVGISDLTRLKNHLPGHPTSEI